MRQNEIRRCSRSSCVVGLFPIVVFLVVDLLKGRDLALTTTMAWTIHRSYRKLAATTRTRPTTSLFLWPAAPLVGSTPFLSQQHKGWGSIGSTPKRKFSTQVVRSRCPSSLYSYRNFLEQGGHETIQVSYFTDTEGDKFYLDRYVDNSKLLAWIPVETDCTRNATTMSYYHQNDDEFFPYDRRIDFLDPNSMLVFGGDLWDKGGFDLYVTRQLLDLKRRYPHRVVWVLGNRDINKLRIMQELGLPSLEGRVPFHPGLMWFRGSGRVGDPEGPLPSMDPGDRLRWILGNTMGSPDAMEHRRQELAWEAGGCLDDHAFASKDTISDEDVVRSYQESCHPRGEMGRFLSESFLAARVGPVLFVHGSLPLTGATMEAARANKEHNGQSSSIWDDLTFCMPWINKTHHEYSEDHEFLTASKLGVDTIEDWLDAVNNFACRNIDAWKKDIARMETGDCDDVDEEAAKESIWAYRGGYGNGPSYDGVHYSDLVQYGMGMIPGGQKNPTVVYNSFTPEGMPTHFWPEEESDVAVCTREFFEKSSLRLILTGHKPQGDMPSPIRVNSDSWVICADTSYSGDTKWFHDEKNATTPDIAEKRRLQEEEAFQKRQNLGRGTAMSFRGDTAVSEVLVELCGTTLGLQSVRYHGFLSDGTEYESVNLLEADEHSDEQPMPEAAATGNNNGSSSSSDANGDSTRASSSLGKVAPKHMVPHPSDSPHEGRWWTKGICRDGSRLYYAGEGYDVWNYIVSPPDKTGNDDDNDDDSNANNSRKDKEMSSAEN